MLRYVVRSAHKRDTALTIDEAGKPCFVEFGNHEEWLFNSPSSTRVLLHEDAGIYVGIPEESGGVLEGRRWIAGGAD